jgi:PAS domain S-box-containing protein
MSWRIRVIISYVVLALVLLYPGSFASAVERPKRVLILHSGESNLPEGVSVWSRETTIWDEYRWEMIGVGIFILLQSLVIFILTVNRTKRRKAERLLHQKEESLAEAQRENGARLRVMADALPVLISYVDKEERFRFNNLAYEKWYDISREKLYGKEVRQVVGEERYTLLQPYIEKVLGGEAVRFEILAPASENQPARSLKATYVPHHDENGSVQGFYTLVEDVTEARRVEMDIRRQLSDLAYAGRVNLMGELTASLAHELNQPLAAILSNAQAARRIISREDPDIAEITEILEDIIADDRRAGEVIRRLRTLLKRGEMEMTDVNLSELVKDAVRLVKPDLTLKDVTMELMLDKDLPSVRADGIQLQQVIINLIVNACTAMQETNPELRKVIIKTERYDPDTVMVSVKDFGTGFDAGVADMLFKPFFTTRSDGMGMGLAVCRHIIEKHGGRIWAVNGPDHGATFSFTLPSENSGEETEQGIVPAARTGS